MRIIVIALLVCLTSPAQSACRHALVLALDVSGSVDAREYRLQMNGLATALLDPKVQQIILSDPSAPISLAVFEWSGRNYQRLIQDWVVVEQPSDLERTASFLRKRFKKRAPVKTAIGSALSFGSAMLAEKSECWRQTIDVSADGENNNGPAPKSLLGRSGFRNIEVNALVIGDGIADAEAGAAVSLKTYFEQNVIRGPSAFAILANGYKDYARAMKLKLIKELSPQVLSKLD